LSVRRKRGGCKLVGIAKGKRGGWSRGEKAEKEQTTQEIVIQKKGPKAEKESLKEGTGAKESRERNSKRRRGEKNFVRIEAFLWIQEEVNRETIVHSL